MERLSHFALAFCILSLVEGRPPGERRPVELSSSCSSVQLSFQCCGCLDPCVELALFIVVVGGRPGASKLQNAATTLVRAARKLLDVQDGPRPTDNQTPSQGSPPPESLEGRSKLINNTLAVCHHGIVNGLGYVTAMRQQFVQHVKAGS